MESNITSDSNVSVDQLLSVVNNTIAATNNTIAHNDATMSNLLSVASNSIAHTDSMVSIYLGLFTAITVALTLIVQIYLARDKRRQIVEAVNQIMADIAKDENLRSQLISEILKDPDFKNDFKSFIHASIIDRLDDLASEESDSESLKKIRGGLKE